MSLVVEALKKAARLGDRSLRSGQTPETAITGGNKRSKWFTIRIVATLVAAAAAGVVLYGQSVRTPEPPAPLTAKPAQPILSPPTAESMPKSPVPAASDAEPQPLLTKGIGQLRDQHLAEARDTFKEAVRLAPNSPEAHIAFGLSLKRLKAYADAEAEYRTALRLDPGNAEGMNNLGLLLDVQGKSEDAISWYQKALDKKPDYHEAHLNLAIALERSGKAKEAKGHYQAFLKSPPAALADVTRLVEQRLSAL